MDALSELLRAVKLRGAVFFHAQCTAPWCVRATPARRFGEILELPDSHVMEFHLVVEGRCFVRVGQESMPLVAGDIALLPHGDIHDMGNGHGIEPLDGEESLPALLRGELKLSTLGGGGEVTRLICGYLVCDPRLVAPILVGLPHVLRVNVRTDPYGAMLEGMVRHAVEQVGAAAPGSHVVAARLAEVLFAEVLRRYAQQLPAYRTGWLAGAGDPAVGRALTCLHRRPAEPWTLEALASEAGVSRSVLTERFARYLNTSPMAYLAEWRLELAAEALRTTSYSVMQVAGEVGYESEAAFNRAFKRQFAVPPARYRRTWRAQRSARTEHNAPQCATVSADIAERRP